MFALQIIQDPSRADLVSPRSQDRTATFLPPPAVRSPPRTPVYPAYHSQSKMISLNDEKRLMSNLDLVGMEKMVERMFEVAATKSSVSTSSLSNDRTCTASSV